MPRPERTYVIYVDDSGNQSVGSLWVALAIPIEYWRGSLGSWLNFRQTIAKRHSVPARLELHSQAFLSSNPEKHLTDEETHSLNGIPDVLKKSKSRRRARFEIWEQGLKTIGSFPEARICAVHTSDPSGPGKIDLYDDLICLIEEMLDAESAFGVVVVDGLDDGGGHFRSSHRALHLKKRRIVEDAIRLSSGDSQLVQIADFCAYAAYQSVNDESKMHANVRSAYERILGGMVHRPNGVDHPRAIRGFDYQHDHDTFDCPSENIKSRVTN